jgi:hypothetical protein
MANEENITVANDTTNEMQNTENIANFQCSEVNTFDWVKTWDITKKIINISSISLAYVGILSILSYPILQIIIAFCDIDKIKNALPIGYTSTVPDIEESGFAIITLGIFCVIIALKLITWLIQKHSIISRIFCILIGSGFMYLMVDKQLNVMLMNCMNGIFFAIFMILVVIPFLILLHNCVFPIFGGIVPSIFSYFKFIFSFLPNTSGLAKACDKVIQSENSKQIKFAKQNGCVVCVEYNNGTKREYLGKLINFSSNSVTIYSKAGTGWYITYDARGREIDSTSKHDWENR